MKDIAFYQSHLDRVSRSFAFCIRKLEPPLRQWVSLSYLMCRILDTVEDSPWTDHDVRDSQYEEFEKFLIAPSDDETIHRWCERFPMSIPEGERALLKDAHLILEDLHESPVPVRQAIQATVLRMSSGMKYYSNRQTEGVLRLNDLTDVNRYCYFVAGIVGELLTRLFLTYRTDFKPNTGLMKNAFHFGLFLQKVNLLKDQRTDELEGRYLIPDRSLVRASLTENAQGAIDYLISIPVEEKGYRTFCAWSLFLGAASLVWIEKSYEADDGTKIPRAVTQELLEAVESVVQDDKALKSAFEEHFPKLPPLSQHSKSRIARDSGQTWFFQLSGNVLESWELADLRMT
jgi:phytoene/squalene synthetase